MIFNSSEDSFDTGNSLDSVFSANPFPQNASDYSTGLNTNNYFEGSSVPSDIDAAIIDTELQNDANLNPPFNLGFYTVGDTGKVNFDYLLNGGAYQGELGIFSLTGLGKYEIGTEAFIEETARRSLSNSSEGHIVISEQTEAAKYTTEDADYTTGKYEGIKTFEMNPGDQFGVMLIPDGTVEEVLENPGIIGSKQPIFSIAPMNPQKAFHIGQLKDMNNGGIWVMEDISADSGTDKDFNDFVFYMEGAVGNAPSFETLVNPVHDWLSEGVGKNLIEDESIGVLPTPNPGQEPNPDPDPQRIVNNGDLVEASDEKVYLIEQNKKRLIPNPGILQGNGFNTDAIKSLSDEDLNSIPLGDDVTIPSQYQESVDVTNNWTSDFYWWDGNGKPSIDFSDNSNNKFATLNLGSNIRSDGKKGISFDWGDGSPKDDNKLLNDNFVVRSYTQANLEKGKQYKAIVTADDGYQLFAKNQNTDKWVYFTSQDEWKEAYGGEEITLEVEETGLYDFHFQYFEKDGDAEFDLSWEEIPPLGGEPPIEPPVEPPVDPIPLPPVELPLLTDAEWDEYSSDDIKFDGEGNDESPDSIKDIYKKLSNAIFGKDVPMSAGYAYDVSYKNGVVIDNQTGWSHSGIDFDSNPSDELKAIVNGKIAKIEDTFVDDQLGYAIGVNELDKNGEEVGRIWWYFHLDSPGDWEIGDSVKAGISNFGVVHPTQGHLHLTVQNDKFDEDGYINSLDSNVVVGRTMSPLQAFWLSENVRKSQYLQFPVGQDFSPVWKEYKDILGNPTLNEQNYSDEVTYQIFENGSIIKSGKGVFPLHGAIRNKYLETNGLNGQLGTPISREIDLGDGRIKQEFENGYIVWDGSSAIVYKPDGLPLISTESSLNLTIEDINETITIGENIEVNGVAKNVENLKFYLSDSLFDTSSNIYELAYDSENLRDNFSLELDVPNYIKPGEYYLKTSFTDISSQTLRNESQLKLNIRDSESSYQEYYNQVLNTIDPSGAFTWEYTSVANQEGAKKMLSQYKNFLMRAARYYGVDGRAIAGVIRWEFEQNYPSRNSDRLFYEQIQLTDSILFEDTGVGWGKMHFRTARKNLNTEENLTDVELADTLANAPSAIDMIAREMRRAVKAYEPYIDIHDDPAILATIYNIGLENVTPNSNPKIQSGKINVNDQGIEEILVPEMGLWVNENLNELEEYKTI